MPDQGTSAPASLSTTPGAAYTQGAAAAKGTLGIPASGPPAQKDTATPASTLPVSKVTAPPGPPPVVSANTNAAQKKTSLLPPPRYGASGIQVPPNQSAVVASTQVPGAPTNKAAAFSLGITPEQRVQDAKKNNVRQPPTNERGDQQVPAGVQAAFQYLETPSESDPYTIPSYVP